MRYNGFRNVSGLRDGESEVPMNIRIGFSSGKHSRQIAVSLSMLYEKGGVADEAEG